MGFSWGVSFSNVTNVRYYMIFKLNNSAQFDMINTAWHTLDLVCDDSFGTLEAKSACYTLGYTNGFSSFESSYDMTEWSEPEIPFLMDNVECWSASTNFLSCSSSAEDCTHTENVLLKCYASGKKSLTFKLWPFPGFCSDFMLRFTD